MRSADACFKLFFEKISIFSISLLFSVLEEYNVSSTNELINLFFIAFAACP